MGAYEGCWSSYWLTSYNVFFIKSCQIRFYSYYSFNGLNKFKRMQNRFTEK